MTKHEWRKHEKATYIAKNTPELINVPAYQFIVLSGQGNPNSDHFSDCIGALYSLAYSIKMNLKNHSNLPADYQDWTVYPLEGEWDITDEAKLSHKKNMPINKEDLVFDLMIRQPDFVSQAWFEDMRALTLQKKNQTENTKALLNQIRFDKITEGKCMQMLHIGSYDDESASFARMEKETEKLGVTRLAKTHREIYLSDFRKAPQDKLKTTLRIQVG